MNRFDTMTRLLQVVKISFIAVTILVVNIAITLIMSRCNSPQIGVSSFSNQQGAVDTGEIVLSFHITKKKVSSFQI